MEKDQYALAAMALAAKFTAIAERIRFAGHDREAIAEGFDLVAQTFEKFVNAVAELGQLKLPCEDCGQPEPLAEIPAAVLVPDVLPVIDAADVPAAGQDDYIQNNL